MVEHAGGELELLPDPEHGKRGLVRRLGGGALLAGLPEEFTAARYHSLHATQAGVEGVHDHRADPGRRGDGDRGPGQPALRRAVPPRVDPHRAGRAGAKVIANVLRSDANGGRGGKGQVERRAGRTRGL